MAQIELLVDDEFKAAGDLLALLVKDLKAGKGVAELTADVLPQLIAVIGAYSKLAEDVKKVDNQVYLLKSLMASLEPQA